jgi:hydrogenase maturation factor HypE
MKFSADCHFIYITSRTDENKEQLQSYYKVTEEDPEEITKEWSVDLLVSADPTELSDINSLEAVQDTPGPSKTKKTMMMKKDEEIHDIVNKSIWTASITPEQDGNDEEVEQRPEDEEESSKKRKVSPLKPSSQKKPRTPVTKMKTMLTPDDFSFLLATMNKDIEEITENKEAKKEAMFNRIGRELQGVQQALWSSRAVSTAPLPRNNIRGR